MQLQNHHGLHAKERHQSLTSPWQGAWRIVFFLVRSFPVYPLEDDAIAPIAHVPFQKRPLASRDRSVSRNNQRYLSGQRLDYRNNTGRAAHLLSS